MGDESKRKKRRFRISDIFDDKNQRKFYVEIRSDRGQTTVQIADISSTGIGFEIQLSEFIGMDMQDNTDVEIKIFYPGGTISANAKLVWNFIMEDDDMELMKGGLMFISLPPEDNQKLSALIESFGKKSG